MTMFNRSFDQSRQIASVVLALLTMALYVLGSVNAFGTDLVKLLYVVIFSAALRFALPKQPSAKLRVIRSSPWIALVSLCLTAGAATLFIEPEGGIGLGLMVFGFYLGLPILLVTTLLTTISFSIDTRA